MLQPSAMPVTATVTVLRARAPCIPRLPNEDSHGNVDGVIGSLCVSRQLLGRQESILEVVQRAGKREARVARQYGGMSGCVPRGCRENEVTQHCVASGERRVNWTILQRGTGMQWPAGHCLTLRCVLTPVCLRTRLQNALRAADPDAGLGPVVSTANGSDLGREGGRKESGVPCRHKHGHGRRRGDWFFRAANRGTDSSRLAAARNGRALRAVRCGLYHNMYVVGEL